MFLEVEEGVQDRDEVAVKVYLIRFIADLPLRLVYGFNPQHACARRCYFSVHCTIFLASCLYWACSVTSFFSVRLVFKLVYGKRSSVRDA